MNARGSQLAAGVEEALARARIGDASVLAVDPEGGRRLILRRGKSLSRIEVVPWQPELSGPGEGVWRPLVVSEHFDPAAVAELEHGRFDYLDESGTARLNLGNATTHTGGRSQRGTSATLLKRSSHRVAFVLLCEPPLAAATARDVAAAAHVSLGTAHATLRGLKDEGFVRERALRRGDQLLNLWVDAYRRVDFPPLTARPLYAQVADWIFQPALDPGLGLFLSGAAAASQLTGDLRATDGVLYVDDVGTAVSTLRLSPTPSPNAVDLRSRFGPTTPSCRDRGSRRRCSFTVT